jgi:KUP system potassium uptake protein
LSVSRSTRSRGSSSSLISLGLSALGVVFGDIGTSPLYTFKTVLQLSDGPHDANTILGSLSLIIWTLVLITTLKYVNVAMRIDNEGEGGILALMSLVNGRLKNKRSVILIGLMGAALIYGDGAITPAISVLSALEGLNIETPQFAPYAVIASVIVLLILFFIQSNGAGRLGKAFGPIMLIWFLVIGVLGVWGIAHHPKVIAAVNPLIGLHYLFSHGQAGFFMLGGVFLCVTGAEALYADMGHFGAGPIRLAWSWVVFPCLLLNYGGQAALVLDGAPTGDNIFYRLCPPGFLTPLVILATIATIIASQSIISGAYSMTRQAIQLGWLPRLRIEQTSEEKYGQIYVGSVNWLLMIATIGLVVGFKKSDNLASAYGIAVSATMLATSVLLLMAMCAVWKWPYWKAVPLAGLFIIVDAAFLIANTPKIAEGGYVPLVFASVIYLIMYIWHRGIEAIASQVKGAVIPIKVFLASISKQKIARVPGTAVFLTRTEKDVPPVMRWHVQQNRALHEKLFILNIRTLPVPRTEERDRVTIDEIAPNVWRVFADYGFMQQPDVPKLMKHIKVGGQRIDLKGVTYYVGHETVICNHNETYLPTWMEAPFAFMVRNALRRSEYFCLPLNSVVEIGRQVQV